MIKRAICVLTRGYGSLNDYKMLVKRNESIESNLVDHSIPLIFFHEGNITKTQQDYIQSQTSSLKLNFIDISTHAFLKEKNSIQFHPDTTRFDLNYRHLCSFWFVDFWKFVDDYDQIIRIDEDCIVFNNIDRIFENLHNKCMIYAEYKKDDTRYTMNLNKTTLEFCRNTDDNLNVSDRRITGPYTNFIALNLNKLKQNMYLSKYIEHISSNNYIYVYRWGDLALWGEALHYFFDSDDHEWDQVFSYFHKSHGRVLNPIV